MSGAVQYWQINADAKLTGEADVNFILYMLGAALMVGGLAYGAHMLGVSGTWIGVGIAVLVGLLIMIALSKTLKGPSPE